MRHAKSNWHSGATSDHERPLNERGLEAARTMGVVLARMGEVPDLAMTSSAVRARTTVDEAARAGRWASEIRVERGLYGTSPDGALGIISRAPDEVERLMVVGHQPAWGGLVFQLTGAATQMKTGTIAIIDLMLGSSWRPDDVLAGELVALLQPRHFADVDWPPSATE
jgi:phosphohistidine phosphatase